MNQEDLRLYLVLADSILRVEKLHIASTKLVLSRFDTLESTQRLQSEMASLENSEELRKIREKLAAITEEASQKNVQIYLQLRDALARTESDHEKLEAVLAQLRASLGRQ